MKQYLYVIALLAATVALSSCNKSNDMPSTNGGHDEIRLTSGITVQTRVHQDFQSAQLEAGNLVGVFINEHSGGSTTYTQNVAYEPTGMGTFIDAPTVYFPASGNAVDIYAYAPRNAAWTDRTASYSFSVQADQHAKAGYIASDLVWGEPMSVGNNPQKLNPVARTKEAINLNFRHLLSKVKVIIQHGAGLTTEDVTKIELLDLLPTTELNMADGTISAASGTKAGVVMADATYIEVAEASAVVVPQTVAIGSRLLRFAIKESGELFYTLPKALTMESGKIYEFTVTMNLTGLTVKSTVTDWATGESLSGEAEM